MPSRFFAAVLALSSLHANAGLIWQGENIAAIQVSGTWSEIGEEAAETSNLAYPDTIAHSLNSFVSSHINEALPTSWFDWFARRSVGRIFYDPLRGQMDSADREMLKAVGSKSGFKRSDLEKAFVTPDALNLLVAHGAETKEAAVPPIAACSSFYVAGPRSETGERILARNFDFPGVGALDKHRVVYLIEPNDGYRILSIGSGAIPAAGISGMNEKGLVAVLHQAYTKNVNSSGIAILSLTREVLQKAATIEEALAIFRRKKAASGWMVHLSDRHPVTKAPRGAIIELSAGQIDIIYSRDNHSELTNHYQSANQQKQEIFLGFGAEIHNHDRMDRLKSLVLAEPVNIDRALAILGDSYSPYSNSNVEWSVSSLRAIDQINSMVFLPDQLKVLVAGGEVPSSRGAYYEFSFEQMSQGLPPKKIRDALPVSPSLKYLTRAYVKAFQETDYDDAYGWLKKAKESSADCSFDLLAGAFALKNKKVTAARHYLETAVDCPIYSPYHRMIARNLLSAARSLGGDSSGALRTLESREAGERAYSGDSRFSPSKMSRKIKDLIQSNQKLSSKWVRNKSKLDLKVMDNLNGWE